MLPDDKQGSFPVCAGFSRDDRGREAAPATIDPDAGPFPFEHPGMPIHSHGRHVGGKPRPQRPEILIRRAETGDDVALAGLMDQLGYPTRAAEMAARLDLLLSRSEDYLKAMK
jgi:hypothetical protein